MAQERLGLPGDIEGPSPKRARERKPRAGSDPGIVVADPLTQEQARALLRSSSVVRDPVHGDIRLTGLERALIDTSVFQRLRHINQLAMVDFVYPGAVHNRFLHSLGTLHVCAEMILKCRDSARALRRMGPPHHPYPVKIPLYAELLARLSALLHDTAHVPFGHVFDREARVFQQDEWDDPWRREKVFGPDSPLRFAARRFFAQHLTRMEVDQVTTEEAEELADRVLDDARDVLIAKKSQVLSLRYPFVADLVGNTICADLLDYVQRDMFFSGMSEGLAKRFLDHLAVLPTRIELPAPDADVAALGTPTLHPYSLPGHQEFAVPVYRDGKSLIACRVVLLQYRYNSRRAASTKHNILAEVIDLVRRRKLIAEKLYFHKTKLVATAMLGTAAHGSGVRTAKALWDLSDIEVVKALKDGSLAQADGVPASALRKARSARLADCLLQRRLFKPVYMVGFHRNVGDEASMRLWGPNGVYTRFASPEGRENLLQKLEAAIGLQIHGSPEKGAGTVVISCPDSNMQLKIFEMFVLSRPDLEEVKTLQTTVRPTVKKEIEAIQEGHQELWRLEVFVDPEIFQHEGLARTLAGAIQAEMGVPNELVDFQNVPAGPIEDFIRQEEVDQDLQRYKMMDAIKLTHYRQLVSGSIAARGAQMIDVLKQWGYEPSEDGNDGSDPTT